MQNEAFEIVEVFKQDRENPDNKDEIIKHRDMLPTEAHDVKH